LEYYCVLCGQSISIAEKEHSLKNFGRYLCYTHQNSEKLLQKPFRAAFVKPDRDRIPLSSEKTPQTRSNLNRLPNTVTSKDSGSVVQLIEEEKELRRQKQHLLDVMDKLERRLTIEIKTRKSKIAALRAEVSELQIMCEDIAKALKIPVIK
jgi:hypothetical protein